MEGDSDDTDASQVSAVRKVRIIEEDDELGRD